MNKKNGLLLIFIIVILFGIGIFIWFNSNKQRNSQNEYEAGRTSTNSSIADNTSNNSNSQPNVAENVNQVNQSANTTINPENTAVNTENPAVTEPAQNNPTPQVKEEQLAIFSTKIYSSDPARQNNLTISCNKLNETIVKNGDTFSFCNTVGQASSKEGYQEADIFDSNGNKKKGMGGGNCQLSTTLYNAVLATPGLVVTERHAHSNYVPYIQKGKDAAVAYGSYDLKFRNDTGSNIKICSQVNSQNVTVSIISLK